MILVNERDEAFGPAGTRFSAAERPSILVGGSGQRSEWLARIAERAGLDCVGRVALDDVARPLAEVAPDFLLLDLRESESLVELRRALASFPGADRGIARTRRCVLVDLAGLDDALALLDGPDADFLCEPADSEIVSMLVMAGMRQAGAGYYRVHDATRDHEAVRLEQLSEEVRRLASTIELLSANGGSTAATNGMVKDRQAIYRPADSERDDLMVRAAPRSWERSRGALVADGANQVAGHAEVRALIRARRMRDQFLPPDLFADPAWDMILDLLASRLAGQRVSVSSLCIAAAVPPTTALRWIRQLTDRAIFERVDDPMDGRRVFIDLTESATEAVLGWVQLVQRNGGLLATTFR